MTKATLVILNLVIGFPLFGQSLFKFTYSDCLRDCIGDSSKFVAIKKIGLLTKIDLRTYAPCNGNLIGAFELNSKILNLKFSSKPTIVIDKKGLRNEVLEVADCNCLFNLEYQIKNLPKIEIIDIRVNGHTLKEIDSMSMLIEATELNKEN